MQLSGKATLTIVEAGIAYTGVAKTVNKSQSFKTADQFQKSNFIDGATGNIIGRAAHQREHTTSVTVIFYDPSTPSTLAAVKTNTKLPVKMMDIVAVSDTGLTWLDGDWNYDGATYDGSVGNSHQFTIELWRGGSDTAPAALPLV